jgi:CHAD domain-containing protein
MTVWIEVAMMSPDTAFDRLAGALAKLPSFALADTARTHVVTQRFDLGLDDWHLSLDTRPDDGGARMLCAVHDIGHPLPGLTRYRTFARPASDDLAASITAFADSDDALKEPLAKAAEAAPGAERKVERMEWRIAAEGAGILVTLEATGKKKGASLRVASPLEDTSFDAVMLLAREIVDELPCFVAVDESANATGAPVHAARLDLPEKATRREAFAAILASVAAQWLGNDAGGRRSLQVEHVHQLRVAQRRLKTALKVFPGYLDDAWQHTIAPDLAWFGKVLAEARDWDVFTDTTLAAYASADVEHASWKPVIDAADGRRRAARAVVVEALGTRRYARLVLAFIVWLARFDLRADDDPMPLAEYAQQRIRKDYRKIVSVPDLTTLDAPMRHRIRIQAKRLRYALEFFRSLTTQRTRDETAVRLARLQTVLGDANDAAVAADRLAAIDATTPYQRGFARAWAAASERKDAEEAERVLRTIRRPRIRASI